MLRLIATILVGLGLIIGAVVGGVAVRHSQADAAHSTHISIVRSQQHGDRLDWALGKTDAVLIRLQQPNGQCDIYVDEHAGHKVWQVGVGISTWMRLTTPEQVENSMSEASRGCWSSTVHQSLPEGVSS